MFENIYLEPEQISLFCEMVEFMKSIPREKRRKFIVAQSSGGDTLLFPSHSNRNKKIYIGDLEELARQSLLSHSFSSQGTPNFDITSFGYRYYDYIKQVAKTSSMKENHTEPAPSDLNINVSNSTKVSESHDKSSKPIFLSYAREDLPAVNEIKEKLSNDGFKYWFDKEALIPGDDWESKIEEAIENAQFVLVFLSTRSITKTGYYQKEVRFILEQRKYRPRGRRYVIPILLEPCEPPREFKDIHWLNYSEEGAYDRLKNALLEEQDNTTIPEPQIILDDEEITILELLNTKRRRTSGGISGDTGIEYPVVEEKLQELLDKGLVKLENIRGERWSITPDGHNYLKKLNP